MVVGDSKYEMEAAEHLGKTIEKCVLKSVKLSEAPSPTELIKQLAMLNDKWDYVLSTFKNLNIRLERKPGAIVNSVNISCCSTSSKSLKGLPAKMLPSFANKPKSRPQH